MIDKSKMPAILAMVGKVKGPRVDPLGPEPGDGDEEELAKCIHQLAVAIEDRDRQEIEDCLHEFYECITDLDEEQDNEQEPDKGD